MEAIALGCSENFFGYFLPKNSQCPKIRVESWAPVFNDSDSTRVYLVLLNYITQLMLFSDRISSCLTCVIQLVAQRPRTVPCRSIGYPCKPLPRQTKFRWTYRKPVVNLCTDPPLMSASALSLIWSRAMISTQNVQWFPIIFLHFNRPIRFWAVFSSQMLKEANGHTQVICVPEWSELVNVTDEFPWNCRSL